MNRNKQEEIMTLCQITIEKFISIRKLLATACSYGTLDLMGGGIISSVLKHDKLNQVIGYIQ